MTATEKGRIIAKVKALWTRHDALEREILLLERKLTDSDLRRIGSAAA